MIGECSGKTDTTLIELATVRALADELNEDLTLWKIAVAANLGELLTDRAAKWLWRHLQQRGGRADWVILFSENPKAAAAIHSAHDGFANQFHLTQWISTLQEADAQRKLDAAMDRARSLPVAEAAQVLAEAAEAARGAGGTGIDADRWRPDDEPDERPPIATWCGKVELRRGNVSQVTAKSKSGKTSFIAAQAAALVAPGTSADCLGWECDANQGAVVYIDFEQSRDDFILLNRSVFKRVGADPRHATHYRAYRFRDRELAQRMSAVRQVMDKAVEECGKVALLSVDGAADLLADVNDPVGSNEVTDSLLRLSTDFDCHVQAVVHGNESAQAGKDARGHLGKQLQRKCEVTFVLEKSGDQVQVHTSVHRKAGISAKNPFTFTWSDQACGFVSVGMAESFKAAQREAELTELAITLAKGDPTFAMRSKEILNSIMEESGCSKATAERRLREMKVCEVLTLQAATGYFHLGRLPSEAIKEARSA